MHPKKEGISELSEKEQWEAAEAAKFMEDMPPAETVRDTPEQQAEKIRELDALLSDFERDHNFAALHAAVVRSYEEAKAHEVRQAAMADLPPIIAVVNYLEKQGLLVSNEHLLARYRAIQRAIGTLREGTLTHDYPKD